jgi:sterol desaturase/sphingolipid hydroxylase (fatty acid hydroxylase superfamily)
MEQYGKILLIAMPIFLLLVLFEKWYGWRKGKDTVRNMDMISSLSSGVTNVTKDVVGLYFVILSYPFLLRHLALMQVANKFIVYVIAFFALDFAGYWVHRLQHKVNFFWNGHIIHHSSEEFNLACALRQSIAAIAKIFAIFLLPAAIFGVPAEVINVVAPLHLFAQFWYHTQHINKMGFLEKIIVTPSHHRVHHAINPQYIDKNYGQIFIFWDKLFGSFQQELKEVPAVYGITRPVQTWNPVKINFQHVVLLAKDAWRTKSWKDKIRIWFMPTGWRPADMEIKYPVYKITDVYNFKKYAAAESTFLTAWSWVQLIVLLLLVSYLFGNIAAISKPGIFIYAAFIFVFVYAFTEVMDGSKSAVFWELLKAVIGIAIIFFAGDWFGLNKIATILNYILLEYFAMSVFIALWLRQQNKAAGSIKAAH